MKIFLQKVLENNKYYLVSEELNMYTNELKSEYFIIEDYSEEEFTNFFEDDITGGIIKQFNELQRSLDFKNLKKNTSLFILIKIENMRNAYEELRNQVLLVEEDSYYFRKFVILYTEDSLCELGEKYLINELYELLNKDIYNFEQDMFFSDSYFLAMELAIKLPFFKIIKSEKIYQTIEKQFRDDRKEYIDEQLLIIFNEKQNYVSLLSDVEQDSEELVRLSKLFSEEQLE